MVVNAMTAPRGVACAPPATGPTGGARMLDGTGEVRVVPGRIAAHATTVTGIAQEVGTAVQTARGIDVDTGAYGLFCQDLPRMMEPVMQLIGDGIAGAMKNLEEVSTKLQAVAGNYAGADQTAGDTSGGLQ